MIEMESAATPLGRMAEPDDIANAALFLASDESRDVNGAEPHRRWRGSDLRSDIMLDIIVGVNSR